MGGLLLDVFVLIAAYVITAGLALALIFFAYATAPRWMARNDEPRPRFLFFNIFIWMLSAAIGGALISYLAPWHPLLLAAVLACILFALIVYIASEAVGKTSLNYEVAVGFCAFACALLGCLLLQFFHLHLRLNL